MLNTYCPNGFNLAIIWPLSVSLKDLRVTYADEQRGNFEIYIQILSLQIQYAT